MFLICGNTDLHTLHTFIEDEPLQRYVSVDTTTNSETIITYALVAEFTGVRVNPSGNPNTPFPCSECSDYANELSKNDSVCFSNMYPLCTLHTLHNTSAYVYTCYGLCMYTNCILIPSLSFPTMYIHSK